MSKKSQDSISTGKNINLGYHKSFTNMFLKAKLNQLKFFLKLLKFFQVFSIKALKVSLFPKELRKIPLLMLLGLVVFYLEAKLLEDIM